MHNKTTKLKIRTYVTPIHYNELEQQMSIPNTKTTTTTVLLCQN